MIDIKQNLKDKGWTSIALGQALGISQPAASKLINGNPSLSNLQKIADVVGCSVSELLKETEDNNTHQNLEVRMIDIIKANLKNRGISQVYIADKLGVTKAAVNQMFTNTIPLTRLEQFATIANCSLSELLSTPQDNQPSSFVCPHCGKPININVSK